MNRQDTVRIVGAGPTGTLLAILLRRRGFENIEVYESRVDPRSGPADSGRSINLALADRGIHALKTAGVFDELGTSLLPMLGRQIHHLDGTSGFQPYGQRANEVNFSISRHRLNQDLIDIASRLGGIRFRFQHRLESLDVARSIAQLRETGSGAAVEVPMEPLLATDGAASTLRRSLASHRLIEAHETDLEHGYKELTIPAGPGGGHRLRGDALHIWPRGNYMLIALPNEDGSFTATLFLPKHGPSSFESLKHAAAIEQFFAQNFPDAIALMPHHIAEFIAHPVGFLGTVSAWPWHHAGAALLGDAAHAMVPFHGQGMNCCFEDCIEFDALLGQHTRWESLLTDFEARRKPNTDAIASMALENYLEMRAKVAEPKFQLQQALALSLENGFPGRFVPRYSMVMFHHEIPYATAEARGRIQSAILNELTAGDIERLEQVDFGRAGREIEARLEPL